MSNQNGLVGIVIIVVTGGKRMNDTMDCNNIHCRTCMELHGSIPECDCCDQKESQGLLFWVNGIGNWLGRSVGYLCRSQTMGDNDTSNHRVGYWRFSGSFKEKEEEGI